MQWCLFLLAVMAQNYLMVCQLYEYHYIEEERSWTEAQKYCRENYTDLATVTNMIDMKRLKNISLVYMKEAWIGLYDQTNIERTWHWSLPAVKYNESETNWGKSEPNNLDNGQNCGIIWKDGKDYLKWGDLSCNEPHYFLCYNENGSSQKFHLINESKTWLKAQSYCRHNHTDLISGLNQLRTDNMNMLDLKNAKSQYIFIGLFSDTWKWSDGSNSSFRHWDRQFDNQKINSGQCAMTVFDDEGRWKREACTVKKKFICYDENKIILIKENKTWEEAKFYCRNHYHDLVTITNLDKQISVQQKAMFASTPFVWMGLCYACTLDLWFWVCDEVAPFDNWAQDGPIDDCDMSGAMERGRNHQWFKRNDTEKFNFICSKKQREE